jgi:hypothetical protein
MRIFTLLEICWIPTATLLAWNTLAKPVFAYQMMPFAQIPPIDNNTVILIGTAIVMVGTKIVDVVMYWKDKNKGTAQQQLLDCQSEKAVKQAHYDEVVKMKDEMIKMKDDQILIKNQQIAELTKAVGQITVSVIPTPSTPSV